MNRTLRDALILVAACLALVWCIPSVGQVLKGSISGTVVDPQGAVVSGAQVKATNSSTGSSQSTTSDSSGLFRFNLISSGTYKIEIAAPHFKTTVENDVIVTAGHDSELGTVRLPVGEASTTIEVTAETPLIDTTQSQVTNTFASATLQTFAGIQENQGLDNLALFVPGVTAARDNGFSNTNGGSGFSVNGLRSRNNDQEIDGQNNNDNSVAGPALFVSDTEFVGQYVLVTNQFGPEYGRNAGSVVNVITKTGGNEWHGSIYENENNSVLNSMNNFEKQFDRHPDGTHFTSKPRLNDEFGGFTIGGPWIKNKVFFFGGFDQEIIATVANFQTNSLTPTPAGLATLAGCFPGSTALQMWNKFGPYAIGGGNPVPQVVPLNPADNNSKTGFVPIMILNNAGTPCDNVQFGGIQRNLSAPTHNFNWVLKNDFTLGGDSITARYLFNRGNTFNNDFGDAAAGYPVNVPALSQAILVSWTHNFSSHMVNEARVGFNRLNVDFGGNTIGTVPTGSALDQGVARVTFRFPSNFDLPGSAADPLFPTLPYLGIGTATNLPQFRIVNTWQGQDNWSYVLGKHQLKAGVNYTFQRSPNGFLPTTNGAFQFDGWGDTVGAGGSFVDNTPNRVLVASGTPSLDFREHDTFVYGGDDWKIGQNLTLNLGLTWTYYGQPANLFNQITTRQQASSAPLWNPKLPASVTTFPTFPAPKDSFGPSVGFAYSPQWGGMITGHGKTTIRGGYRYLYDPPFYNIYINMSSSSPEVFLQSFTGASRTATSPASTGFPVPVVPTGPNVRNELTSQLQKGVFDPRSFAETSMASNFGPDKVHSWNIGFEREVTKNAAVELRYVGNHGNDLFQSVDANPTVSALAKNFPSLLPAGVTPCPLGTVVPGPGQSDKQSALGAGRVNCAQGNLRSRTNGGFSNYHGLQAELRANNLFKQLTVRSAYTWSKTLDNVSEIFSTFAGANSVAFAQNPLKPTGEYSFSGLHIPNQFTIIVSEQFPFFKEQHGLVGHLFGGWGVSANYIWASGQRYTPSQVVIAELSAPNYFDSAFYNQFNGGVETARPFISNPAAPVGNVGIFALDACNVFGISGSPTATDPLDVCSAANPAKGGSPSALLSLNFINTVQPGKSPIQKVDKNSVRYIANGGEAETIFGTPFGNAVRNGETDAVTNVANMALVKRIKFTERTAFEFHASALNIFNHPNFQSIDPFLEDAGLNTAGTGFGNPAVTNTSIIGNNNSTRRFTFGGTFRF